MRGRAPRLGRCAARDGLFLFLREGRFVHREQGRAEEHSLRAVGHLHGIRVLVVNSRGGGGRMLLGIRVLVVVLCMPNSIRPPPPRLLHLIKRVMRLSV